MPKGYTGEETWLKRAAHLARGLLGIREEREKSAEVSIEKAHDLAVYPRAFTRYLEIVKLPGEGGLSEYERLRYNADLFTSLLFEVRTDIAKEAEEAETVAVADHQAYLDRVKKL